MSPAEAGAIAAGLVIVGDAKITIRALAPRVFEALLKAEDLQGWWSANAVVEPGLDGRYETNPVEGVQEGLIVHLEAPRKLTFTWPMAREGSTVETTVSYELLPKGQETVVHVIHRSSKFLERDWHPIWRAALESLKAYVETGTGVLRRTAPGGPGSA